MLVIHCHAQKNRGGGASNTERNVVLYMKREYTQQSIRIRATENMEHNRQEDTIRW